MDQGELYQKRIEEGIQRYRKNLDRQLQKTIRHEIDMYELYLTGNAGRQDRFEWVTAQKKLLRQLKTQKQLIGREEVVQNDPSSKNLLGQEYTQDLRKEIDGALKGLQKGVQKAIEISSYIRVELDRQINQLDAVYDQNRDIQTRLKRAKDGLIVILRKAMTNKLTRFFAILLVIAVIGLIVVLILKNNGAFI